MQAVHNVGILLRLCIKQIQYHNSLVSETLNMFANNLKERPQWKTSLGVKLEVFG